MAGGDDPFWTDDGRSAAVLAVHLHGHLPGVLARRIHIHAIDDVGQARRGACVHSNQENS